MRARRGVIVGWATVGLYAAALLGAAVTTSDGELRPGDRRDDGVAARELVAAWERSRTATFVRSGTFERRSDVTGAVVSSEDVLVQRPPQRLHRQLGGVDGRDDDRAIFCPAVAPGDAAAPCQVGPPGGATYAEDVASEVEGLRSLVTGPSPLYAVDRAEEPGCFELAQLRSDPRARLGLEARFCFDAATGAPASSRVRYAGGIVEVVSVTDIQTSVSDDDLRP